MEDTYSDKSLSVVTSETIISSTKSRDKCVTMSRYPHYALAFQHIIVYILP